MLIEWGGKNASLFGPTHSRNLLKITTLFVYLALLFYLAPEGRLNFLRSFIKKYSSKKGEKTRRDEKTDHNLKTKGNNEPGGRILIKWG